jgi:hypothetical protein
MSARPARTAQDALREMLASMNDRQFILAAKASGVSLATLRAFADGRSTLPSHSLHRLGEHIYAGRYFQKREERA